jgi:hypothetical protein
VEREETPPISPEGEGEKTLVSIENCEREE